MSDRPDYYAVIPAAGVGSRMQSERPKQYLEIAGRMVIEHTVGLFLQQPEIEAIVVCTAPEDSIWPTLEIAGHAKVINTHGGATRADSVLNGLAALADQVSAQDRVLVHDAARPCLSSARLSDFLRQLGQDETGGIMAIPASDTIKQAKLDFDVIESTLDRSRLWQAQTPQMFPYQTLRSALEAALAAGFAVTDEASAMEYAGYQPRLIEGSADNIKITRPADLQWARFWFANS